MFLVDPDSSLSGLAQRWRRMLSSLTREASRRPRAGCFRPVLDRLEGREAPGGLDFSGGFAGAAGLTLNGSAALAGSRLRLTEDDFGLAGSVFSDRKVRVSNFHTQFQFQFTPGTIPMADGITFTFQNTSPTALGSGGGNLGYEGIGNSVAVKWDLHNNDGEGTNSTGVFVNGEEPFNGGVAPATGSNNFDGTGIDLHSGHVFEVAISYHRKSSLLTVVTTDTVTDASATQTYNINLTGILGYKRAFVGFTGATGGLTAVHDIINWQFDKRDTLST